MSRSLKKGPYVDERVLKKIRDRKVGRQNHHQNLGAFINYCP